VKKLLSEKEIKQLEIDLFLDILCHLYGLDLKNNAPATIERRLNALVIKHKKKSIIDLLPLLIHKNNFYEDVIETITIQYSYLFRNSFFFLSLVTESFEMLHSLPKVKIWIAGCANGEEVYSLLILLHEANLLEKTTLYATDISKIALKNAQSGILQKEITKEDIENYNSAGGKYSLSDYFSYAYGKYKLKEELLSRVIFKEHNLAQDKSFVQADVILCRNVMIYFNLELQERVIELFNNSLVEGGYLGIGIDESLAFISNAHSYTSVSSDANIYKKDVKKNALVF